jgi:hypothetical protein
MKGISIRVPALYRLPQNCKQGALKKPKKVPLIIKTTSATVDIMWIK